MAKRDDDKGPEADGASAGTHVNDTRGRQRVAKLMARAGLCSRRDAEVWVTQGRVTLNGSVLSSPAVDVGGDDVVLVDGQPLPDAEKTRLFLFHKPRGLVTSDHDPEGRPTVADHLRAAWPEGPRVVTVGRLDINTEGLLLLTNDGGLARVLELPQTGWARRYRVRAKGQTDQAVLDGLREGVTIEGIDYAGIEARLDRTQGSNCWLTMGLREGKNREVKRVLEHVGLEVNRLIRLSFGPFQLGDLPDGAVSEVKTRILRDQLGEALAAQAGVDFHDDEAPVEVAPARERKPAARPTGGTREAGPRGPAPRRVGEAAPRRAPGSSRSSASPARSDARGSGARGADAPPPAKRERPAAGPRKHVSLLRAGQTTPGPRKRTERTSTRDSADREIAVERLEMVREVSKARAPRSSAPKPYASKSGAARARASEEARREDDRAPRGSGPARRVAGASPSAVGKRERVMRSGGAPQDTRQDTRGMPPSDQKRPRGRPEPRGGSDARGDEPRRAAGRDAAPMGDARRPRSERPRSERPPSEHRPTRPGATDRGRRDGPSAGSEARSSRAPSFRETDRTVARERPARQPRGREAERGAARRPDRSPDGEGRGARQPRTEGRQAVAGRPRRNEAAGTGPRGRPSGKPAGGRPTGDGPSGGKTGGGKTGGDKPGGGRPAGRPKR